MNNKIENKEIVILSAAPQTLQEAQRFMHRRQYNVHLHGDLKNFLAQVVQSKPEYVFISANYSHGNLKHARRLLEEVYRARVVDFIEDQSLESVTNLRDREGSRKIPTQLTGPAMERFLTAEVTEPMMPAPKLEWQDQIRLVMGKTFNSGKGIVNQPLTWTHKLTCIQVSTPSLKGHFVVAMGMDRVLDADMIKQIESTVREAIKSMTGEAADTDAFFMDVRRVEFKKWAVKSAEFVERTVHNGIEVAAAFFQGEEEVFQAHPEAPHMVSIGIDGLQDENRVGFELYLHLPLSNKFLLYVPRGGYLTSIQQQTLETRGIKRLHVPQSDVPALRQDRFRSACERSISEFYESRAA